MSCWIAHWMDAGRPSPMIMTPLQRRSACHSVGGIKTLSLYRMYYIYIFIWCLYICVLICIRAAYICRMYTDYRAARAYGHAFANQHREIPYVSICIHVPICVYTIVYLRHYLLKYLSTESTIIHAGLGEGLGKGHPAAHGYSFGSLRRRGVAPVCRCKKVSGNYKSTNDNWVMNRCIWYTHIHYIYIYIWSLYKLCIYI